MNLIHENYEYIPFRSNYILQLHRDLLQYTELTYGGKYKTIPNEIDAVFILSCGKSVYNILGIKETPVFGLSTVQVLGIAFFGIFYTHCRFNIKNTLVSGITIILYILCVGKAGIIRR